MSKERELIDAVCNGSAKKVAALFKRGPFSRGEPVSPDTVASNGWPILCTAVSSGYKEVVEALLRAGANIDLVNKDQETPLWIAAQNGRKDLVEILLRAGANVNLANCHRTTPLGIAVYNGHKEIVEILLRAGANIDLANTNGTTPLMQAAQNGFKDIAAILLQARAQVNLANEFEETPLFVAASHGHKEVIEVLLRAGAQVNLVSNSMTPLWIAAEKGYKEVVEVLLREGAKVDLSDLENDRTPLWIAAFKGHADIVAILLRAGAKIDLAPPMEGTPLYVAVEKGHKDVVAVLLRAGANLYLKTLDGYTSLMIAIEKGHKEIEMMLRAAREAVEPIYIAAKSGNQKALEALLRAGTSVDLSFENGETPLFVAASNGYKEIVAILLAARATVDLANDLGWSPLYVAASNGYKEVVELLLQAGAKVDLATITGWTPLHFAALNDHREAVKILLQVGANIGAKTKAGKTPLMIATDKGHKEIAMILQAAEKPQEVIVTERIGYEAEARRKEQEIRERQEREAREKQEREAKAARERAEAELLRRQQEVREKQEREAWERQEREAKAKDSRVQKLDEASLIKVISYLASKQSYLELLKSKLGDLVAKERGPLVQLCSKMQGLLDEIIKEFKSLSGSNFQLLPIEDQTTVLDLINHLVFINPDIIDVAWLTKELAFLASKQEYLITLKRRIEVETKQRAQKVSIIEEKLHNFELEAKAAELASDYKAVIKSYVFIQDCYNQIVALGIDRSQQLAAIAQKIKETQSKLSQTATPSPSPVQERHEVVGPGQVKCRIIPYVDLQLDQELGSGGFGTVYRGLWRTENIAAKKLHTTQLTASSRQAFIAEVEIMSKLDSERLVRLYGVCVAPDPYCIVMEYMPRGSLYSLLHGTEQYSWQISLQIAIDIGNGLAFLHREKVIHRDLKSLNVLLDAQYRAKICDFGLSKVRQEVSVTSTRPVTAVGTNAWNAPELFGLRPKYTYASDIYAYGIILWEILTREILYKDVLDPNQIQIAVKVGEREEIPASCSPVYRESIERCWGQVPEKRPEASHVVQVLKGELATIAVKSWHVAPELKPAGRNAEGYYIVDAGDYDVRKVVECYQRCPVPGMEVGRVKIIFNPVLNKSFADGIELLEGRFGNPAFAAKWSSDGDARITAWRSEVIRRFEAMAQPYQDATFPHVKILPVWHGTRAAIIGSIAKTGYANLATTDAGFFGKGLYSSYEAEYAYRVYGPGSQGANGILVVNWIACFSAYPVVGYRVPGYGGVVPEPGDMERLKEKGNFGNYDAHFVPVRPATSDPNEVNYYPCRPSERATYHEVVVFEKTQILPRYIVELQPVMVAPLLATAGMFAGKQPKQEEATKTHAPAP